MKNVEKRNIKNVKKTEYYIKYTSKGMPISKISKEQESEIADNEWLKGVSCFVINNKSEVLVEQRVNRGLTPGKLDLCSGHTNNYEIPMQAMLRELEEELGVRPEEAFSSLRQLKSADCPLVFESKGKFRNFFITFFCLKKNLEHVNFQKEEIKNIKWIPMEELFKMMQNGETKFPKEYNYTHLFEQVRELNNNKILKNKTYEKEK